MASILWSVSVETVLTDMFCMRSWIDVSKLYPPQLYQSSISVQIIRLTIPTRAQITRWQIKLSASVTPLISVACYTYYPSATAFTRWSNVRCLCAFKLAMYMCTRDSTRTGKTTAAQTKQWNISRWFNQAVYTDTSSICCFCICICVCICICICVCVCICICVCVC